ncbi:hypothetical protein C9439_00440 [archaeon SCG-AAA382B04]|nr:hypothetical protein C9439_00440 [archaeon SCG-AAA382B04]
MLKKHIKLLFLLFLILITLSGCLSNESIDKEANTLGEPVFVQAERGEANTTKVVATDLKIVDELKTNEKVLEAGENKNFLLIKIETGVLIKKEEIILETKNEQIMGTNSNNRTFRMNNKEMIDFIYMVESHDSIIGLYPGAEIEGWVIFLVNEQTDLEETYIELTSDIYDNKTLRWKINE